MRRLVCTTPLSLVIEALCLQDMYSALDKAAAATRQRQTPGTKRNLKTSCVLAVFSSAEVLCAVPVMLDTLCSQQLVADAHEQCS